MATTNIELDIENITGVSDANNQFIISAQKFVVASIPKNLLLFASKQSSTYTGGSGIAANIDSVVEVQRNGYSCRQIPISESKWAADSTSLRYATSKHPVWWFDSSVIKILPEPSGSEDGYYYYIDYSEIDDDSDLRNAVIFHAVSSEFSKLANSKVSDWNNIVPPSVPTLSDNSISFSQTAPVFVKPSREPSVSFNDYWTLSDFGDSDPGSFSISGSAPIPPSFPSFTTPDVASVTVGTMPDIQSVLISNVGSAPTYTAPTVSGDGTEMTSVSILDADNTIDTHADQIEFDQWWSTATHLIEGEEDIELAGITLQKISTYINAYGQAMQNQLNVFNDANVEYQAKLQEAIQQAQINSQKVLQQAQIDKDKVTQQAQIEAQEKQQEASLKLQKENQEYAAEIQRYSAEINEYQNEVNKQVQEYSQKMSRYQLELNTVYQSWVKIESDKIEVYKTDIQNETSSFNEDNVEYQAQLQISIQNAQLSSQDDAQKLQKYNNEIQEYQNKVNQEAQKLTSSNRDSMFYANESKKYYDWSQLEINSYIKNNSKMIGLSMQANQQSQ